MERRVAETTPITTQQIPESLAPWGKNREKITLAMQKAGKIGNFWGNAFPSRVGTLELLSTCVQSNRLRTGEVDLR